MVDLLLVRRLTPFHANVGKRLVKSTTTHISDSDLVHTLLRLDTLDQVPGHPISGMSWEGHVVESLLRTAPARSRAGFDRTAAGAEMDLVLELPGDRLWAVAIKRGFAPKLEKGLHNALDDLNPSEAFVVCTGTERYPKGQHIEVIGAPELAPLS
jgi:predicted AAA+ superfamily ATPase